MSPLFSCAAGHRLTSCSWVLERRPPPQTIMHRTYLISPPQAVLDRSPRALELQANGRLFPELSSLRPSPMSARRCHSTSSVSLVVATTYLSWPRSCTCFSLWLHRSDLASFLVQVRTECRCHVWPIAGARAKPHRPAHTGAAPPVPFA
jgi:hypothetical protein